MKRFIHPQIRINIFQGEHVEMTASQEQSYEQWELQQRAIESIERRFTALNEITKFSF
ncbi:MAG: hypothetical protein IJH37_01235 [Clostridia bacterium]|nr:hypothetical protein [Clostridia bacterium]